MSLRLVWSKSLSAQPFDATLAPVKSFGGVVRAIRIAKGLSQTEVADAGGLEQSRISEIERGRYLPGLDMAVRLAAGLGVTLTEMVSQWEGAKGTASPATKASRTGRRGKPAARLDVPQEDVFRRVRGLWELMTPERRDIYWKQGKALVAAQWKEETRGEFPRAAEPQAKTSRKSGSRG